MGFDNGLVHVIDTLLVPPLPLLETASQFSLTGFAGAVVHSSLNSTAAEMPNLTIFAPANAAFKALGATLEGLSPGSLTDLLSYHVVNSSIGSVGYTPVLANGTVLITAQGASLNITTASNSLFVNSARVLQSDILLKNGVLHVIDNLLSPNATAASPDPSLRTQAPVIQGSRLSGNEVPFTEHLPSSVTSAMNSAIPTGTAKSTFDVGDIGAAASTTTDDADGAMASQSAVATSAEIDLSDFRGGVGRSYEGMGLERVVGLMTLVFLLL